MLGLDTLGWLTRHDPLAVVGWSDPVSEAFGHDPRSEYVETFWLPILGPSCTLAARRVADRLDAEPEGFVLALSWFARCLGLGAGTGRHAPITRSMGRLVDFGMARVGGGALGVRRWFPPLAARQCERLPTDLAEEHATYLMRPRTATGSGAKR